VRYRFSELAVNISEHTHWHNKEITSVMGQDGSLYHLGGAVMSTVEKITR